MGIATSLLSALCLFAATGSPVFGQASTNPAQPSATPVLPEGLSPAAQPESKLGSAVMRTGKNQRAIQPFRAKVGDKEYDFAQLLRLKPADTKDKPVQIVTPFQFKHAALLNNLEELAFIKEQIQAGKQPWAGEFEKMKKSRFASRDYLQKMAIPPEVISCDFSGRNDHGSIQEMKDANAAYTQALMWYFTGDKVYAENTAGILDTYAKTVTTHIGKNWYLEAAWAGSVFPLSAELLRATYPEWKNHRAVGKWFNDVFLPPLHNRMAFGNREFIITTAFMAIGIYNEDLAAFYLGLNHWMNYIPAYHYLSEDGPAPYKPDYWTPEITPSDAFLTSLNKGRFPEDWTPWMTLHYEQWSREKIRGKFGDDSTGLRNEVLEGQNGRTWNGAPATYLPGYCAETARDFGHVEQSFASEINAAEMAWHQGIDVYTPHAKRLTTFMETQAGLRLGEEPPATMTAKLVPYGLVGTFEIAYNHYANKMGIPLPKTRKIIEILRQAGVDGISPVQPGDAGRDPENPRLWKYAPPIPSLFASKIGGSVGWLSSWEALTHGELGER